MNTREWPALCAWGAGLIHLASGAGTLPSVFGIILIALGIAEFAWGIAALRSPRAASAGAVLVGATVALAVSAAAALTGFMAWLPLVAVSVQLMIIAVIAAVSLRSRRDTSSSPAQRRRAGRTVASVALCAALVSGLTTPALAATDSGDFAVPHGTHGHHG